MRVTVVFNEDGDLMPLVRVIEWLLSRKDSRVDGNQPNIGQEKPTMAHAKEITSCLYNSSRDREPHY